MISSRKIKNIFIFMAVLVSAAFVLSVCTGKYPISIKEIWAIVSGGEISELKRGVFYTLRLPRTVMALLAGLGLGLAGAIYQTIFKNPLASPDIIGVASGANLGAAIAIGLFGFGTLLVATSAFIGGMLITIMVVALVRTSGNANTVTYILAGIILKSVSEACIMLLKFFADPEKELAAMDYWSMGSLANITASKLNIILPVFLLGFAGVILLRRQVALLGLEDDEGRALGVRVGLIRIVLLGVSTLMVASVICLTGLISFIGLIAPHIARLVLKRTNFTYCILASLVGAFILLAADCFARSIHTSEIPISIFTTVIGVPCLVYFMRSKKAGRI